MNRKRTGKRRWQQLAHNQEARAARRMFLAMRKAILRGRNVWQYLQVGKDGKVTRDFRGMARKAMDEADREFVDSIREGIASLCAECLPVPSLPDPSLPA